MPALSNLREKNVIKVWYVSSFEREKVLWKEKVVNKLTLL